MTRKIIKIDDELCIGCGACADACHEGAIEMVDGKAKLVREDYCDGLGNCLPVCPVDAISFEEREVGEPVPKAAPVKENVAEVKPEATQAQTQAHTHGEGKLPCGCPGTNSRVIDRQVCRETPAENTPLSESMLSQWPVQIKLVPVNAPYFDGANLLVAADCTAYAYGDFHRRFIRKHVTLIGCPKLDDGDYAEKLTAIITRNNIKSVTVVRMEVPCCGGIEHAVKRALQASGKLIPWQAVTISTDGQIIE
jgi:MinD superfamily P-loop ATPase containing an inserted ferredoxin domain